MTSTSLATRSSRSVVDGSERWRHSCLIETRYCDITDHGHCRVQEYGQSRAGMASIACFSRSLVQL